MSGVPTLQIVKFEQRPRQNTDGSLLMEDWVTIGPVGGTERSVTNWRVRDIVERLRPLATNDPASIQAHARADIVRRAYQMWKSGQELPEEGTPLAAWNAVTPAQAEVLRTNGFKTVESVAAMTDAHVQRIPLPCRELIRQAKAFLGAQETNRVALAMEQKDKQLEVLNAETTELRLQLADALSKINALADMVAASQVEAKPKKQKAEA